MDLIKLTDKGLYCPQGDFYIDPFRPVKRAVVTHSHGDHAYGGHELYISSEPTADLFISRLGDVKSLKTLNFGQSYTLGDCKISLHPAGHILGSSQVRIECDDQVWVMTGDYKRQSDPSCEPFEVVPCDTLVTESTFAFPIYRWKETSLVAQDIIRWWKSEPEAASLLFCYSLGKSQRIIREIRKFTAAPIYVHSTVEELNKVYTKYGYDLGDLRSIPEKDELRGELIITPPGTYKSQWMRQFKNAQTAFASGWMAIRGNRRRRGYEMGFVLSDHADWNGLINTVKDTGAKRVLATHGSSDVLARYCREELGLMAESLRIDRGEEDET